MTAGNIVVVEVSVLVLAGCIATLLAIRIWGTLDIFEPIVPATIAFIALFSVRPLFMVSFNATDYYRWLYIGDSIEYATLVAALGVAAYNFGYLASARAKRPVLAYSQRFYIARPQLLLICAAYVALGLLLLLIYLGASPLQTLQVLSRGRSLLAAQTVTVNSEYLFVAPILLSCAATLLLIGWQPSRGKPLYFALCFLLVIVPVVFFYLVGTRRFIVPCVCVPFMAYFLSRRTRPKLTSFTLGIVGVFVLAAIPYMRTEGAREQIGGVIDQLAFAFTRSDILLEVFLGEDSNMLPVFAAETKELRRPDEYYLGRAVFGDLLLAPIPSALFRKPRTARDDMLIRLFDSPCDARPGGICPDFSAIGTFYQDFALPGVVFWMLFFGWLSRRVWQNYCAQPDNPYRLVIVTVVTIFTFIIIRAGFMPAFQWALYFLFPLLFGVYASRRRYDWRNCQREEGNLSSVDDLLSFASRSNRRGRLE